MSSPGIHDTLGAAFIGLIVGTMLFGITVLQVYQYFIKNSADSRVQKSWVTLLFTLDAINLVFAIHAMYHYLIFNFGDLEAIHSLIWSIKPFGIAHVFVIWIVQGLYLWRIWRLSNMLYLEPWIVRAIMICLIVIIGVGLAAGIVFLLKLEHLQSLIIPPSFAWVILFPGCLVPLIIDMSIAGMMCFLLWSSKADLPSRMDHVVLTLVRYIISTGLLTSLTKLAYLLLFSARPDTLLFLGVEFSGTRLYVNSYLALLNARNTLRDELDPTLSNNTPSDLQLQFNHGSTQYSTI